MWRLIKEYGFLVFQFLPGTWLTDVQGKLTLSQTSLNDRALFVWGDGLCRLMVGSVLRSRCNLHLKFYSVVHSTVHPVIAQEEGPTRAHCCILPHTHIYFSDTNPGLVLVFSQNAHMGTYTTKHTMCERGQFTMRQISWQLKPNKPFSFFSFGVLKNNIYFSAELRNPTGNIVLALDTDWAKISF